MTEAEQKAQASQHGKLANQVAIVTGAGHGIGRAIALQYAREGARVAVLDIDENAAKTVADEIGASGGAAAAFFADVSDEASTVAAAGAVVERFGQIDILMNNAAMFTVVAMSRVPFEEVGVEEWNRLIAVNTTGTWLMCRAAVPAMRRTGRGKIINIGSGALFKGTAPIHYLASKGAVYAMTHGLARELGRDGITVNCICPGSTLSEEAPTEADMERHRNTASTRALPRHEVPDDIVGTAVFFAAPDSDFITGQTLMVDGGAYFL